MPRIDFPNGLAIVGIVAAIVLVVLDNAGKLKGPMLYVLLGVAACLTLPLVAHIFGTEDAAAGVPKYARWMLTFCAVGFMYAFLAVWISSPEEGQLVHSADEIKPLLKNMPDPTYRDLVAEIIHEVSPSSRVSVGTLVTTPDGTRTIDVEVTDNVTKPFITDIAVIDLPIGQPAGVEIIDAADSKRSDIKADAMLVCSNTGFDATALSKAKRKKIGVISVVRQDDKRVKAVIEEEVYLRDVAIKNMKVSYDTLTPADRETLNHLVKDSNDITYQGTSVSAWLQYKAVNVVLLNPYFESGVESTFKLKEPADFDIKGHAIKLKQIGIFFQPHTRWLKQTVQLDATSSIYDYARGRFRLKTGSVTLKGINFDTATPLPSPPQSGDLGMGLIETKLAPDEVDFVLMRVNGLGVPNDTKMANLDGLVRPEDLDLQIK